MVSLFGIGVKHLTASCMYGGFVLLMATPLGESIRDLRKRRGLSQSQLGARVGVSRQTMSNWENEDTSPSFADIEHLAEAFGVSVQELLGDDRRASGSTGSAGASGRSEGRRGPPPPDYLNVVGRLEDLRPPGARPLPVYRWGSMGDPRDHESAPSPDREEYPPTGREGLIGPRGFAVEVRGNSMSGRDVRDGDLVWVNPDKPYRLGSLVLALVDEGDGESGMVVKLYARSEVGDCLMSDSEDAGRSTVPCRQFTIVGPVTWIQRGFPPR